MKEKGDNILAKIILLTLGVCSDLLASSIAYGAGKIKISFQSAFLVSLVGTAALWAALCLSESPLILINTDVAKADDFSKAHCRALQEVHIQGKKRKPYDVGNS